MQRHTAQQSDAAERLAVGLGWFSIGLGIAELAAPRKVARLIGVRDADESIKTLRAFGAREVGNGLAILREPDRPDWLWSRVAGDIVDLASLVTAPRAGATTRGRIAAATGAVLGITALDVLAARRLSRERSGRERRALTGGVRERARLGRSARPGFLAVEATTVNRPIEDVYRFWRNFENFPRFMRHLEFVTAIDDRRSRWKAKGPAGLTVEWEAEIVEDRENHVIAWRSLEGSDVDNRGSVHFERAPGARGTEVRVEIEYRPPAGTIGRAVAWLLGKEPEQQIREDLRRVKQLLEAGEIPLSEGPGLWRPARPAADPEQIRDLAGVRR